jgi:5-methylcytosine-specific restriction endonuclease McrA
MTIETDYIDLFDIYLAVQITKADSSRIINKVKNAAKTANSNPGVDEINGQIRVRPGSLLRMFNASHWKCAYCGTYCGLQITIDHKIAKSAGGLNLIKNMIPACATCNRLKAEGTVAQLAHRLNETPKRVRRRVRAIRATYDNLSQLAKLIEPDKFRR